MQFPESWLREFCDPPLDTAALSNLLTMSGMEVEDARPAAPPFEGVVVGRVVEVARHPNADRLNVCVVDVGGERPLSIVCGAPNVRPGIKTPCALVGARLPAPPGSAASEGLRIERGVLRGVESEGMLCSARELQLSDDHGGLLLLDDSAPVGADLRRALRLDDTLLTLKLTPNLGHCLSVHGIAREVSALTGATLATPTFPAVPVTTDARLAVRLDAPDLCGRFSGRVVANVDPSAPTPGWMVDRLARCGQRSVSALVDISNYVMFEYGRPSHIFDLDKIHGGLEVRWARAGESLELLNGSTVALDPSVGVIADGRAVESLAGIMGGAATAVSDATRNVYVEAAFWWPDAVAGRSRRFNFTTDAGHRFERGVDPATTVEHLERITRLIVEICGTASTACGPVDDQVTRLPDPAPVAMRVERAARVIGLPVSDTECADVMRRLGLPHRSEPGVVTVLPPSWRFDLRIEEDLIEEVIRVIGYDRLPARPPRGTLTPQVASESRRGPDDVRLALAGLGYRETINFSFVDDAWERDLAGNADPVRVLNPIASALSVMRSSLVGSLVAVLRSNAARKAARVRVFEVGRTFARNAVAIDRPDGVAGLDQPLKVGGLAWGAVDPLQWGVPERAVDFFDVKADVEALFGTARIAWVAAAHPALHPGRSARIELEGRPVGFAGELHPKWRQAYELSSAPVVFELEMGALAARRLPAFVPLPRQQGALRDLSVVAGPAVTHDSLVKAIREVEGLLVRSVRLFDIYKPKAASAEMRPDERSLAMRLEIRDDEKTLTDAAIDGVVSEVLSALRQRLGVRLRG